MIKRVKWLRASSLFLLVVFLILNADATEVISLGPKPLILNPVWLSDAIQIQITPRGQKLFSDDFMKILTNLSIVPNENYFPAFDYVTPEPIKLDDLAASRPNEFGMLINVRQFFKQYLRGIQFKDFNPVFKIGKFGYVANIQKLSLVTDQELMKNLGKTDGAVLAIKVLIKKFVASSSSISANDLNNKWMGTIQVKNPEVVIAPPPSEFFEASMPFYVRVDKNGNLEFEVLKLTENLNKMDIGISYEKIILPSFEFKVVGESEVSRIDLDENEFRKIVDEQLPNAIESIRSSIRNYLQVDLPNFLNQATQENLKSAIEQLNVIPAPNQADGDTRPPFYLGMKLSKADLIDSQLKLKLSAFVEDTSVPTMTPFWPGSGARNSAPNFSQVSDTEYDLGLSIDRGLFNRIVHLAFNRKNFKKMETCPGDPPVELLSAPSIDFNPNKKPSNDLEGHITLFIDALAEVPKENRKAWIFPILESKIHITMKYQAMIKPSAAGSANLSIYLLGADVNSLKIDDNSIRGIGNLFKGKIKEEIQKMLSGSGSCGNGGPLAEFGLMSELLGQPLEYAKIKMDPQGHLMLFMNYKK
jgi:hypothetical protein